MFLKFKLCLRSWSHGSQLKDFEKELENDSIRREGGQRESGIETLNSVQWICVHFAAAELAHLRALLLQNCILDPFVVPLFLPLAVVAKNRSCFGWTGKKGGRQAGGTEKAALMEERDTRVAF